MRIKNTLIGILRDPELMQYIFTGLGYFMLAGAILRLSLTAADKLSIVGKVIFVAFSPCPLALATSFWLLHVIRPIVRITWPHFGVPCIDEGVDTLPYRELVKRIDILVFVFLGTISTFWGWNILKLLVSR